VRYEWRLTPHLIFTANYGYNHVSFLNPNRKGVDGSDFAYDVEFAGQTARIGWGVRF
jgi:hypothetical protein